MCSQLVVCLHVVFSPLHLMSYVVCGKRVLCPFGKFLALIISVFIKH